MGLHIRIADFYRYFGHQLQAMLCQLNSSALNTVLPVIIIHISNGDTLFPHLFNGVFAKGLGFDIIQGINTKKILLWRCDPVKGSCRRPDPGNLPVHEITLDRKTGRSANTGYPGKHSYTFLKLFYTRFCLGRIVCVVKHMVDNLSTMDAPFCVDHLEKRIRPSGNTAPSRSWSGLGAPLPDMNLRVRNALFCNGAKAKTQDNKQH